MNRAEHALERQRDAGDAVVLEHGQVDDRVADLRQRAAQQAARLAEGGEVVLKTQHVVAKTPHALTALDDLEAGALQVGVLPVPDDDLGNSRLPQALRDGLHQLRVRGVAPAPQTIHLQPHHLARPHHLLPCFEGRIAVKGGLQGAVKQLSERRRSRIPSRCCELSRREQ